MKFRACAQRQAIPPAKDAALERRWGFSSASEGQRLGAIALGAANCVGVLYLGSLLGSPGVSQMLAQSSLGFMNGLFPFLQVYVQPPLHSIRLFFCHGAFLFMSILFLCMQLAVQKPYALQLSGMAGKEGNASHWTDMLGCSDLSRHMQLLSLPSLPSGGFSTRGGIVRLKAATRRASMRLGC